VPADGDAVHTSDAKLVQLQCLVMEEAVYKSNILHQFAGFRLSYAGRNQHAQLPSAARKTGTGYRHPARHYGQHPRVLMVRLLA